MKPLRMPRKKRKEPTAADRGYITRENAAKALRQLAGDIEMSQDGCLVKLAIQLHSVPDDGSVDYEGGVFEIGKDESAESIAPTGH